MSKYEKRLIMAAMMFAKLGRDHRAESVLSLCLKGTRTEALACLSALAGAATESSLATQIRQIHEEIQTVNRTQLNKGRPNNVQPIRPPAIINE